MDNNKTTDKAKTVTTWDKDFFYCKTTRVEITVSWETSEGRSGSAVATEAACVGWGYRFADGSEISRVGGPTVSTGPMVLTDKNGLLLALLCRVGEAVAPARGD